MVISFSKYHGTGNDFIIINNWHRNILLDEETIKQMCRRRFGIGADGLIFFQEHDAFDFEMIYYNADGKPGTMCGNGGRCAVKYAIDSGIKQNKFRFMAADGVHDAQLQENGWISLKMFDIEGIEQDAGHYILNTGSPHVVVPVLNDNEINVVEEGRKIRNSPRFEKEGVNVNFVEEKKQKLYVRTYERGVENETLSCGTGVTASALVFARHPGFNHIEIDTPGGNLVVEYTKIGENKFNDIWLCGPAQLVYKGSIEILEEHEI